MALSRQIGVTIVLAAILAAGWLWISGWEEPAGSREPQRERSSATLVIVEPLSLAEDRVVLRTVGTSEALKSASLHPAVSGEVVEVLFDAEQRVYHRI